MRAGLSHSQGRHEPGSAQCGTCRPAARLSKGLQRAAWSGRPSSLSAHAHADNSKTPQSIVSWAEVQKAAQNRGLELCLWELGPLYRISITVDGSERKVLALTTGFVAPWLGGIMHCDTLQVFTAGLRGDKGDRIRGGALGLGLIVGGACMAYGLSKGCKKAEILAINDDEQMHARLIKYYTFFGFRRVATVEGDKLKDLPHMLVWGGAGTRMDSDMETVLGKWTPALRKAARQDTSESKRSELDTTV